LPKDHFNNPRYVADYVVIPKSNHSITVTGDISASRVIPILLQSMLPTI